MSTVIAVDVLGLLSRKEVSLSTDFPCSFDFVSQELNSPSPDKDRINYCITPQVYMKIPGICLKRKVLVYVDHIIIECRSKSRSAFTKSFLSFCEMHDIKWEII